MIDFVSDEWANGIGLFGAGVYLFSYALLQFGVLKGQSYTYAILNILAASSVLFSLISAFNMSSLVIQVSWITISIVGIVRLFVVTRLVRFSEAEEAFLFRQIPHLRKHQARRLLNKASWLELMPGTALTVQGEPVTRLLYIDIGQVSVDIDGHIVGNCDPGTFIGELTFMNGGPATATVRSMEMTRCLCFDATDVIPLLRREPEIEMALIAGFSMDTKSKLLQRNKETIETSNRVRS